MYDYKARPGGPPRGRGCLGPRRLPAGGGRVSRRQPVAATPGLRHPEGRLGPLDLRQLPKHPQAGRSTQSPARVVSHTEFGVEKDGLLFPSLDLTEEAYAQGDEDVFLRARTRVAYSVYTGSSRWKRRPSSGKRSRALEPLPDRPFLFPPGSIYNGGIPEDQSRREVPVIVLKDVLALLDVEVLTSGTDPEAAFQRVFASDLMSDVLTSAEPGLLLLTGLANSHVVSTCHVADVAGVVFVQGKRPSPAVVEEARAKACSSPPRCPCSRPAPASPASARKRPWARPSRSTGRSSR
ncbi:MAG: hypothetical protein M0C28_05810 [Candidatus Moduliflexus flocculans]|nr:hypothetical protein [Candidatus Moduliflexus flocculans]